MSDRLGDDVLLLILDHFSHLAVGDRDSERQATLRSVCLASRRFRRLAQPLLGRHIRIRDERQLERLRACSALSGLGHCTRVYEFRASCSDFLDNAFAMADCLPCVADLRVHPQARQVEVRLLESFSALTQLRLVCVALNGPCPAPFQALEHLTLHVVQAPTTFFRRWLEPSRLPVLRTICVGPLYETPTWSSPIDLDHVLARPLLHQLDYIRATPDNLNLAGPIARGVTPPVLFYMLDGIHAALPPFPFPKHIAVPPRLAASSSIQPILNWLTVAIERAPKPPADEPAALVILSREVLATAAASAPVAQSVQALEAACQWREVRLVWLAGECRDLEAYGEVVVERDFGIEVFVRHALEFRPARGAAR